MLTLLGQPVSALELVAFVTGLLSVWLTLRMHIANWPVGLVNVACFSILFLDAKLYADALLQVAFFALGLYGWWNWSRSRRATASLPATRATARELAIVLVLGVACTWGVRQALLAWTDSPAPLPDAAILVLSLLATWLQALRRIESWLLWITVDLVAIPLYWSRSLPLTAILFFIFLLLCIGGLLRWKSRLAPQPALA
jgi:nicotinamide mononucleotide transporter